MAALLKSKLEFTRHITNLLITAFPEDQRLHQPYDGANHLLWQVGHLGVSAQGLAGMIDPSHPKPDPSLDKLFGVKSAPMADASAYPDYAEVHTYFDQAMADLIALIADKDDAWFEQKVGEEQAMFGPTFAGVVMTVCWHEGLHAGQITTLRKSLGLDLVLA